MKIIVTLFLIFAFFSKLSAQEPGWQWLNPKPQGNIITSIYFTSDLTGYAATSSNCIMKTTDGGLSWELKYINNNIVLSKIQFLNSQTGYISTTSNKLCKSTNAGENWEVIDALRTDLGFRSISFKDVNTGYATYDSLYRNIFVGKTTDGGVTWYDLRKDSLIFSSIVTTNGNETYLALSKDSSFYGYKTNLYKSTNGGLDWSFNFNFAKGVKALSFSSPDTGYIYLTTFENSGSSNVFKTVNGGDNWFSIDLNRPGSNFQVMDNNNIYQADLGYSGSIYYSSNGGFIWQTLPIPNPPPFYYVSPNYNIFHFIDVNTGIIAGPNMIRTTNAGSNWSDIYPDNLYGHFSGMDFVDENTGFIASSQSTYKTTNGGTSWSLTLAYPESFEDIQFINSQTGFMGSHWGIFARTTNGGDSWDTIRTNRSYTGIDFLNENTGYSTGKYGPVSKTTNGGANWTNVTGITQQSWDIDFLNVNTGLVCSGGAFKRTTDGGATWDSIAIPFDTYVYKIKFINENEVLAGTLGNNGQNHFILKSINGGVNWDIAYTAEEGVGEIEVEGDIAYAIGYTSNKLFKSRDRGNTWRTYITISNNTPTRVKFVNENTGFICGFNSMLIKTTNGGFDPIGIEPISAEIPNKFLLHQNYPNPFNPATKIKFSLPKAGLVSLKIYNLLGQQVSELVNQNLNAGVYEYNFDGAGLPSGVYFYRLETGGVIETKRMMLIK
jgi:photosystem II stability/assembly factor-like uncharacterized protein